jgi:tetratricopeptide (TPR) repeat protein
MTDPGRPPPRFSVVVIARDEGHTLPRLLGSLAAVLARGGEVLVLDTGSVDGTLDVARRHGARVAESGERFASTLGADAAALVESRFAFRGEGPLVRPGERLFDFAAAREHAGWLARHDHVLQVDASDEVLALDVDFVDAAVGASEPPSLEYRLLLGGVSLYVSRLYDRRRLSWRGRVHEALWPRDTGLGPPPRGRSRRCSDEQLLVRHHWDPGKTRSYVAGLALDVLEHPEQPRWLHYLGRELHARGRHRSAIALLEAHAARTDAWITERSASLCLSGRCFEALGDPTGAEAHYRRAIGLDATWREPFLRLAALCQARGDFDGVVEHATAAIGVPRTSAFAEADANYGDVPHALLYWALFWLGRRGEARDHWEAARRLAPDRADIAAHARLFRAQRSAAD